MEESQRQVKHVKIIGTHRYAGTELIVKLNYFDANKHAAQQ